MPTNTGVHLKSLPSEPKRKRKAATKSKKRAKKSEEAAECRCTLGARRALRGRESIVVTSDQKRFLAWWSPAGKRIGFLALKASGSVDFADEIVQDMAALTWEKRELFATPEDLLKWGVKRGGWLVMDRLRGRWRRLGHLQRYATKRQQQRQPLPSTDEMLDLAVLVERLPARQKQVIKAHFEGQSESQTATEMGVARATVRSLRRHAVYRLAESFGAISEDHDA